MFKKFEIFKNKNSLKKELSSLYLYTTKIEDDLIRFRIEHLMDWYIRKAAFYKNLFYWLSLLLIAINAFIPVLTNLSLQNKDIIISFMSSIATIITSSLTLFTMKDTWFRYRNHAELIKAECVQYSCHIGAYEKDKSELLLMENIENIINSERKLWENTKFDKENNDIK